jgi:RNA polymerase subunit RPABC4/transcription elongation factor Spt4
MSSELINTIGTIVGVLIAALGAFLFAFWIAMGIWTFNDVRARTRDWLVITLAVALVLIFPLIGLILYMMIRPKSTLAEVYDRALEEEALLRELEETMTCHQCGAPVNEAWVYCPNCHSQLQHSCPSCGKLARNEWEICVFCGSPQPRTATVRPQLSSVQPAPQLQPVAAPPATPGAQTTAPLRNPFRREATPPTVPPPFNEEPDDAAYQPARMPE